MSRTEESLFDFEVRERADEDNAAANYDRLYHTFPVQSYWDADFVDFVAGEWSEGDRVLDLGCGPASLWDQWKRLPEPGRLVGVDLSPGMIRCALEKHPGGEFVVGRAHDLPFESGAFDVVVCSAVLHHIPDDHLAPALAEVSRVLDEHGRLVGREPCEGGIASTPGWLSGAVMNFRHLAYRLTRSREYPEPPLGDHHHAFDPDAFREALEHHLKVTRLERRFPFSSYVARVRSEAIATIAATLDHRLGDRSGTMFYFSAGKNHVDASDVARAVQAARGELANPMSDEEFLAYLQAAAQEIERTFAP